MSLSVLLRRLASRGADTAEAPRALLAERRWAPYSRLLLVGEDAPWVIAREVEAMVRIADRLGIERAPGRWHRHVRRQSVFYGSQFALQRGIPTRSGNRLGFAYFHGLPGTPGAPEFDEGYETLRRNHVRVDRVQVSHVEMRDVVLGTGIDPAKVFVIPIGVDDELFAPPSAGRAELRRRYGIPESAVVVGSFQKDGVGWDDGEEPKLIKGPDVLVDALGQVKAHVPELFVLLTGPARGFVRKGLEAAGIPYRHLWADDYRELPALYATLDAYAIPSRQEGGPKALFEAMAVGVPVVTTRVGQAADLAVDGDNALVVDVDDASTLADALRRVLTDGALSARLVEAGAATALAHTYRALEPRWRALLDGFVALGA